MPPSTTIWTGRRARSAAVTFNSEKRRRKEAAFLADLTDGLPDGATAVDFGAGAGFLTLALAEGLQHGRVVAVDLSADMLAQLNLQAEELGLQARVQQVRADVANTGLESASAELAVSSHVVHEIPDPAALVREMARVLKPGGRLVIKDFRKAWRTWWLAVFHHGGGAHGPLRVDEMADLLTAAGLADVQVQAQGSRLVAKARKPA